MRLRQDRNTSPPLAFLLFNKLASVFVVLGHLFQLLEEVGILLEEDLLHLAPAALVLLLLVSHLDVTQVLVHLLLLLEGHVVVCREDVMDLVNPKRILVTGKLHVLLSMDLGIVSLEEVVVLLHHGLVRRGVEFIQQDLWVGRVLAG